MKFFRNVLTTFLAEAVIVGLNFALGVLVARLLPVDERGVLALVMLLPVTLAYFVDIGISQAIVYFLGRKLASLQSVLGLGVVMGLGMGGIGALILWAARSFLLSTVLQDVPEAYFGIAVLLLPVLLLDTYGLSILRAQQRFGLFNLRRLLTPLVALIGVILLVGFAGQGIGGAVAAFVTSFLLGLLFTGVILARELASGLRWEADLAKEAFHFGMKSYLQNLVGHLNYRLDIYILALFLPPAQVAYYTVATSVAEVAWYLPNSVGTVLFPKLASEPDERIHALTAEVTRHTLAATAVITLLLLAGGWWLVPVLYGPQYRPAIEPLLVLAPGILTMAVYKILTRNFTSRHRQQVSILAAAVALVINIGLNLFLVPRFGVLGAAFASLLSYSVSALILLIVFRRQSGIPAAHILWLQRKDLERYREVWLRLRVQFEERGWLDHWLAG